MGFFLCVVCFDGEYGDFCVRVGLALYYYSS